MTTKPTREESKKIAERFVKLGSVFTGGRKKKWDKSSLLAIAQALLDAYKREEEARKVIKHWNTYGLECSVCRGDGYYDNGEFVDGEWLPDDTPCYGCQPYADLKEALLQEKES